MGRCDLRVTFEVFWRLFTFTAELTVCWVGANALGRSGSAKHERLSRNKFSQLENDNKKWGTSGFQIEFWSKCMVRFFDEKSRTFRKFESRNFCLFTFCSWADPLNICRPAGEASRINMNFYQFDSNTQTSKFNPEYSRAQSTEENLVGEYKMIIASISNWFWKD